MWWNGSQVSVMPYTWYPASWLVPPSLSTMYIKKPTPSSAIQQFSRSFECETDDDTASINSSNSYSQTRTPETTYTQRSLKPDSVEFYPKKKFDSTPKEVKQEVEKVFETTEDPLTTRFSSYVEAALSDTKAKAKAKTKTKTKSLAVDTKPLPPTRKLKPDCDETPRVKTPVQDPLNEKLCPKCHENMRFQTSHKLHKYCKPCFQNLPICENYECERRADHKSGYCAYCFHEYSVKCFDCHRYTVNNSGYCYICSDFSDTFNAEAETGTETCAP